MPHTTKKNKIVEMKAVIRTSQTLDDADADDQKLLEFVKEIGLGIDPSIAEITWTAREDQQAQMELTGVGSEYPHVDRIYAVRNPGVPFYVSFEALPENTRKALWERIREECPAPEGSQDVKSAGPRSDLRK